MKTSELSLWQLDWAVLMCECNTKNKKAIRNHCIALLEDGFSPSTNWAHGGPIIEHFGMCLLAFGLGPTAWSAHMSSGSTAARRVSGPTPLIAAMRCYVASKLGDEVDVPKELL